jgi:epoxyqueuosine reductase QueG
MILSEEIENIIKSDHFTFFGIAGLSDYSEQLIDYGYPLARDFSRSISIGLALSDTIVDKLTVEPQFPAVELYRHFCYDVVNQRIDRILTRIAEVLSGKGYESLPVPASGATDKKRLYGPFSHKAAAYLSGQGWIGKSCLLINEAVGPRARWGTVLTDAPLPTTGKPLDENCGNCDICVKKCPAGAFTGNTFNIRDKREIRYDAFKCDKYLSQREQSTGYRVCGICLAVCPYGKGQ